MLTPKNDSGSLSGRVQDPPEEHFRKKVTLINFICSILVIYIHVYNLDVYGIDSKSGGFAHVVYCLESFWRSTLSEIPVSLFFFLSGFLFFRTYSPDKLFAKYASRAKSLLIPYLVWTSAYFVAMGLLSLLFAGSGVMNADGSAFTFGAWLDSLFLHPRGGLWFLQHLIVFVFLTPVIYALLRDRAGLPTGLLTILLLYLNLRFSVVPTLRGLEIYSLGSWIGINHKRAALKRDRTLTAVSILFLSVWFLSAFRWNNVFTEPLMLTAIWFALDLFDLPSFPWWMRITFFTYVAHYLPLNVLEKLFLLAFGRSPLPALVDFLFMPIVMFLILTAAAFFLKRRTPKLWEIISGGR